MLAGVSSARALVGDAVPEGNLVLEGRLGQAVGLFSLVPFSERGRGGGEPEDHHRGQVAAHCRVCLHAGPGERAQESDGRAQGQHHVCPPPRAAALPPGPALWDSGPGTTPCCPFPSCGLTAVHT